MRGGGRMGKITKRLIRYFTGIICVVGLTCIILSSIFLSVIYTDIQYRDMREASEKLYRAADDSSQYGGIISDYQLSNVFTIRDGKVTSLTGMTGGMGMNMSGYMLNLDFDNLEEKGKFETLRGGELLYYRYSTGSGDIIVIQNNRFSSAYMRYTYIILAVIFMLALLLSIPVSAYLGKKITEPVIELQKASMDITKGKFDVDVEVKTGDEIQDLSESLKVMAESLEQKFIMQRDFIANVSHDFKTPLSVIRNYSEAIYDGLADSKASRRYSGEIISEVDRLNSLVMELLELSKIQSGKAALKRERFSLNDFLKSFGTAFEMQLIQKNARLDINPLEQDTLVLADAEYLHRVVYNFLDNAVKYCGDRGEVSLNAARGASGIKVSVRDSGPGIDPAFLEHIWERYYKGARSGGMGLGLAIASELLKLHGFKYGVESRLGEGSEFYFIIP
ncbi:MAG: resE2 [Firmicutes bacterium]|nr:resE2 [Bacillota bacterium]